VEKTTIPSYYDLLNAIKQLYSGTDDEKISNFALQYLYRTLLEIYNLSPKAKKLLTEFVIYFINYIIAGEKAVSKVKQHKIAKINAAQELTPEMDPNMVDNRQTRMYDEIVDPDAEDKFTYDDMDYDGKNDTF
jgi:hypothetical protein